MISPNLRKGARVRVSFDGEVVSFVNGNAGITVIGGNSIPTAFGAKDVPHLRVELLDDVMVAEARRGQEPPAPASAPDLLKRAADIMGERGQQYDRPSGERAMAATVKAFNTIVGREALTETEGWLLMLVLKMVRARQNTRVAHKDSYEDGIAYAALAAESALTAGG